MRIPSGVTYDNVNAVFEHALPVNEVHLVTAAGMFGDFNPLHVMGLMQGALGTGPGYSMDPSQRP